MLLQAQNAELQRVTAQIAEKKCVVEVKQAEIIKLEDCLTNSIEEVATVKQGMAIAAQANSAAAQVCNISACCLAVVLQMHMSKEQLFSWYIC